ncbi:MAG: DUF58 domain-containing protein [Bacteroidota bacterium]
MIKKIRNLYLPTRFFLAGGAIVLLFIAGFPFPVFFSLAQTAILFFIGAIIVDIFLLFNGAVKLYAVRSMSKLLSLGNENKVTLRVRSEYKLPLSIRLIDELPFQLQKRDFSINFKLSSKEKKQFSYKIRPLVRGEYNFGKIHLFAKSILGIVERRISLDKEVIAPVYPSVMDMKKYEIRTVAKLATSFGIKKIRRLGHSYEFEQIKEYVIGDDYQSVNWKATSRANRLMVNHYEDERAQQIYSLIDKSRYMKMPFNGLSLLDYAINASLVISNTALLKQDKAGLITFSDKVESIVKSDRHRNQLKLILETLYREEESKLEANYELMYSVMRNTIKGRSLVFLFSNFESIYSLERVLPMLRRINKQHLLVVVVFENTELINYYSEGAENLEDIYLKTIAHRFASEKNQIINELRHFGIQSIFTKPEQLTINSINKYLELKSRGMI